MLKVINATVVAVTVVAVFKNLNFELGKDLSLRDNLKD